MFQLLHNAPDDGGGGEPAWPDFEVPAGVGAGGDSQDDTAGPTSAGDSDEPGREAQGDASHDGAPPPPRQGEAPGHTARNPLPPGRVDEIQARADARYADLEKRFNESNALLSKLKGVFAPEGPKTDPRTTALRNRLLEVVPELKDVLEIAGMSGDLKGLLQRAPGFVAQEQRMWADHATRTLQQVHTQIAPFMLGDGASADQLTTAQKEYLAGELQRFCLPRANGGLAPDHSRVDRYEKSDPTLIEEFRDFYASVHVAPARRSLVTNATRRAAAGSTVPRAGRADAAGATIPKADPTDDDAVHNKAWTHLSSAFAGRR